MQIQFIVNEQAVRASFEVLLRSQKFPPRDFLAHIFIFIIVQIILAELLYFNFFVFFIY